ncbi:histone-lysine N-methyltransferase 2C [Caerostris extrusa]|uniref:Histone-lysine N-methyltransferase 2C n=1 Tax=Caerostris extrusa TaxID=172846 RepID=A0AAV4UAY3_CAEEX|nr:histone-lysine N-methyltransferase 2C [Caerostris extrusa]
MADEHSGIIKFDKESNEVENEKVSIPYNHQLAPTSRLSVGDAEASTNEFSTKLQQAVSQRSASCDAVSSATTSIDSPAKTFESPFGLDRIVQPLSAKRARGRPRKDFPRPPKPHLTQPPSIKA